MTGHTVALYCIADGLLKAVGHGDGRRRAATDAEVLTTALSAAHCFRGPPSKAPRFVIAFAPVEAFIWQLGLTAPRPRGGSAKGR